MYLTIPTALPLTPPRNQVLDLRSGALGKSNTDLVRMKKGMPTGKAERKWPKPKNPKPDQPSCRILTLPAWEGPGEVEDCVEEPGDAGV